MWKVAVYYNIYRKRLAIPEPVSCSCSSVLSAGVETIADLKHANVRVVSRVTAKQGLGQGTLASSSGSNNNYPWVRILLILSKSRDNQKQYWDKKIHRNILRICDTVFWC